MMRRVALALSRGDIYAGPSARRLPMSTSKPSLITRRVSPSLLTPTSAAASARLLCSSSGGGEGNSGKHEVSISVDRSGLLKRPSNAELDQREEQRININATYLTELAKELIMEIEMRGPISVGRYMTQCLTHPHFGYYNRDDVIGQYGDFITSPEISQTFGEMIGVWCFSMWELMGRPEKLRLVELGPGKGTLMKDVLMTLRRLKLTSVDVDLVEISSSLKKVQQAALESFGPQTTVTWHNDIAEVPEDIPMIVLGHEFLDALPVQQFELTADGWRERLVDVDTSSESPHHFRMVISPQPTLSLTYLSVVEDALSKSKIGDVIEVSPRSWGVAEEVSKKIVTCNGAALFIDYGEGETLSDTVRAIKDHEFVDLFQEPGRADLSASVDFGALKRVVESKTDMLRVHGPVTQGSFLLQLGLAVRISRLVDQEEDDGKVQEMVDAFLRLTSGGEDGMGESYKVSAILPSSWEDVVGFLPQPEDGNEGESS